MKRVFSVLLAAIMLLAFAACDGEGNDSTSAATDSSGTSADGQTTQEDKETMYLDAGEYYNNGYTLNTLCGIDEFGRSFDASSGKREGDKQVGIFYFLTLGQHTNEYSNKIYDASEILKLENGVELMFGLDGYDESIAPEGATYFWGKPLYGYYNSGDSWVIRRHLTLLASAGVDYLCFDVTNGFVYETVYMKIMKEICTLKEQGWEDIPGVVFYTHAQSTSVIRSVYDKVYKLGLYQDAWYYYNGKPLIIGYTDVKTDIEVTGGDYGYNPEPLTDEMKEFFSFKRPEWPSEYKTYDDSLPWIEWTYPAPVHGDVINVDVASHPALPMSWSITRGADNWGRGWSVTEKKNITEDAVKGTFFQSCWDVAIAADPAMVFVTGWNEWTAGKSLYTWKDENGKTQREYIMVDTANMEFSRDAELMSGGYNDAFYLQLASNIRKYKFVSVGDSVVKSTPTTIDMNESTVKWNNVKAVFRSIGTDNSARNYVGASSGVYYKQDAARNNICELRVAQDAEYIYFYIKTDDVISAREDGDTGWMNIFIGTGELSPGGWNGYEYIVNRNFGEKSVTYIEKLNADFTSEQTGEGKWYLSGNILQVRIPRSAVGLENSNSFYFKVADGIEKPDDIMDYYVSGSSLPMGRLSFRYLG